MESIKYFINVIKINDFLITPERKEIACIEGCAFCSKKLTETVFLLGVLNPITKDAVVTGFCENCIKNFEHVIKNIFGFEQVKDLQIKDSSNIIHYFINGVIENE